MTAIELPPTKLKVRYGTDPFGFFWPGSEQKRLEIMPLKRNAPEVFESVYQGRPGQRIGRIFRKEDFTYYVPPEGLDMAMGSPAVQAFCRKGHLRVQAWDTAFSTTVQSAHTVCVTGLLVPCFLYHCGENEAMFGPCPFHYDVMLLDVWREKVDWGDLLSAIRTQNYRWSPQSVLVEERASGISIMQTLRGSNIPLIGVSTENASKGARAVNRVDQRSAGSVQGWFRQHRVLTPAATETTPIPWKDKFEAELKDFTGDDDSSADQVDATVHLVTHAIRLSSQTAVLPSEYMRELAGTDDVRILGEAPETALDDRMLFLQTLGEVQNYAFDPYEGSCGRCVNNQAGWCSVQQRKVIAMDSCEAFSSGEEIRWS